MLAIVSVILLHSLPEGYLFKSGAPFHIWQAVPLFLILTGYNGANSFKKRNYDSISQFYSFEFLYSKIERILYPFLVIWVFQVICYVVIDGGIGITELIKSLLTGGWGPGNYFIPIIIQATLLMPLIFLLAKRSVTTMTLVLFVISIALEVVCLLADIPENIYRLLIVRYVFALALGVWLAMNNGKTKWLASLSAVSFVYIGLVSYFGLELIMEKYWLSQHAPSYFWTLLLITIGLNTFKIKNTNIIGKWSIKIGQASYHIFLVQMVYFWAIGGRIPEDQIVLHVSLSLLVCLIFGLVFYEMENKLRSVIKHRRINKEHVA